MATERERRQKSMGRIGSSVTLFFPVPVRVCRLRRAGNACLAGTKRILRAEGLYEIPDKIPDGREMTSRSALSWLVLACAMTSHDERDSATPARAAAGVALQAGAVAHECEVSAGAASVAFEAFHAGFGCAFGIDLALLAGFVHRSFRRLGEAASECGHHIAHRIAGGRFRGFQNAGADFAQH